MRACSVRIFAAAAFVVGLATGCFVSFQKVESKKTEIEVRRQLELVEVELETANRERVARENQFRAAKDAWESGDIDRLQECFEHPECFYEPKE